MSQHYKMVKRRAEEKKNERKYNIEIKMRKLNTVNSNEKTKSKKITRTKMKMRKIK